ncbi:hypothetical protein V3C99_004966 [Haemonchus contortus]
MAPKKQGFKVNGLHSFVRGLIDTKVWVELRAGTFAIGILQDCDQYLNLRIRDALILRARKKEHVDEFFICGRHLRYIHLARYVDVAEAIRKNSSKPSKQHRRQQTHKHVNYKGCSDLQE